MSRLSACVCILVLGWGIRAVLFTFLSDSAQSYFRTSIETMSPVTSFPRLKEGKFFVDHAADPYMSGYFKLNPLVASIVLPFVNNETLMYWCLVIVDSATTVVLMWTSETQYVIAGAMFFLFPHAMMSEFGLSVGSVDMLLFALFLFIALRMQKTGLTALALACLVTVKPVSPLTLIFPVALCLRQPLWKLAGYTLTFFGLLQVTAFLLTGSWSFFYASFVSPLILTHDLEPTMGMAWAIFSLVFPDTVSLFRLIFHSHLFIIAVPVYWRMQSLVTEQPQDKVPAVLERYAKLMTAAAVMYQANVTAIDFSLIGSILAATDDVFHDKLSKLMSSLLIVGLSFTSAVAPLWLSHNTASPNFFFLFGIVTTFLGMLAIGQGLKVLRLHGYTKKVKPASPKPTHEKRIKSD